MDSEFEIHDVHNLELQNKDNKVLLRHFDKNNILEFTDKLQIHAESEFYVLVVRGELTAIIHEDCISIKKSEIIMIKPGFKSGFKVYTDEVNIEFYTIVAPKTKDPIMINTKFHIIKPLNFENQRVLKLDWGVRIPYKSDEYRNQWLFGYGKVPIVSDYLSFVSVVFDTEEDARKLLTREYIHSHTESYEYYVCLEGKDVLNVGGQVIAVSKGEIREVLPGECHIRMQFEHPFDGFIIRSPAKSEKDKVECKSTKAEIIENHEAEECHVLQLSVGDEVIPQHRKTHYEGWTYCEHEGKYGWIPDNYLQLQPNNNFVMKNYYSSYELECVKGEIVEILIQESGWYFVKNDKARVGWIPIEKTN